MLPDPRTLPRLTQLDALAAFVHCFDHRVAFGAPFAGLADARSGGRLRPRGPLESTPEVLVMLADAWFPPGWAAQNGPVPVTTVSMHVVLVPAQARCIRHA